MHFSEQLLFCTARIEGSDGINSNIGTGFIFAFKDRLYLITNRHVVNKVGWRGAATFLASIANGGLLAEFGRSLELPLSEEDFVFHQDPEIDVAVTCVTDFYNNYKPFIHAFESEAIPTTYDIKNLMRPQEEVLFVGYPRGIWDSVNIMPITRKGMMATSYELEYLGKPKFLIDAAVFEGSSGSPVFVFKTPPSTGRNLLPVSTERLLFVGILSATRYEVDSLVTTGTEASAPQRVISKTYLNLGTVYKPRSIIETIETLINKDI